MKLLNLGKTPQPELNDLRIEDVKPDMEVVVKSSGERAIVVAVLYDKVTYRLSSGQYSCLPKDFVKRFGVPADPSYEVCKQNLAKALNVPDDVAATILKTGTMPEGF